jgi:hypothetical protein
MTYSTIDAFLQRATKYRCREQNGIDCQPKPRRFRCQRATLAKAAAAEFTEVCGEIRELCSVDSGASCQISLIKCLGRQKSLIKS